MIKNKNLNNGILISDFDGGSCFGLVNIQQYCETAFVVVILSFLIPLKFKQNQEPS
jgi:hypothetical protein